MRISIYRRKDGLYCHDYYLGTIGGKPKKKYFYGKTPAEVRRKVAAYEADRKEEPTSPSIGLTDYIESWIEKKTQYWSPRLPRDYRSLLKNYITPVIGTIPIQQLTKADIERMIDTMTKQGKSSMTIRNAHALLRAALNDAKPILRENPATFVSVKTTSDFQPSPLTITQVNDFFEVIKNHEREALYYLMILTGPRLGEATGMLWSDVDLDAKTWSITGSLQRVKGGLERVQTKTKASRATIGLPESIVVRLKLHQQRQQERGHYNPQGYVFLSRVGTPIEPRCLLEQFYRLSRKAGIPQRRLHDLRHTCGMLLASNGVPQRTIMAILRHTQLSTSAWYSQVFQDTQRDSIESVENALRKQDGESKKHL